jgi:hypothetical protein
MATGSPAVEHGPAPGEAVLRDAPDPSEIIGRSFEGRPLVVRFAGDPASSLRILVVAGQHGDEPGARRSALRFLEESREGWAAGPRPARPVQIAVLEDANPDGAVRGTRANAEGRDLNRDHLELRSPETQALHRWIRAFRPAAVLDVHNYPSRRRHLLAAGRVLDTDVLLAVPTHPAVRHALALSPLLDSVRADLEREGFTAGPYLLFGRSGRVRSSTLETFDARNGLALRYDLPTFLVEGREPRREEGAADRERLLRAQTLALRSLVSSIADRAGTWRNRTARPRVVPVRAKWVRGASTATSWMRVEGSEPPVRLAVPEARTQAEVTGSVPMPDAYAVPDVLVPLLGILARQGFREMGRGASTGGSGEVYEFPASRSRRPARRCPPGDDTARVTLSGYRIFPTDVPGGRALAVWLEPDSPFGLAGREDLGLGRSPGLLYPVLRLVRNTHDSEDGAVPPERRGSSSGGSSKEEVTLPKRLRPQQ